MTRELRVLTVKVNVDVSEAISGLKALQREAKQATKELRELERSKQETEVRDFATLQNDKLADFILAHYSHEIHENESAADIAMRLLTVNSDD